MKVIYAVEWVESESDSGQRPEGYKLFRDLETCKRITKIDSADGPSESGNYYLGPVRPLYCVEVPLESLEGSIRSWLKNHNEHHTDNNWTPKFRGTLHAIGEN